MIRDKNILVTGGAGMIGSNLVKKLVETGNHVKVIDNLWRGKTEYLLNTNGDPVINMDNQFFNIDLSIANNLNGILKDVEYVVHLADIVAGIGYVFENQGGLFRQNNLINSNTLYSIRESNVKGVIYIGTACSFPETLQNSLNQPPLIEEDLYPAQPESAYGWSKLMGQYETGLLEAETNIDTCTLMLHNVYGSPCDYSPEKSQVIPSLIRKAINYPEEDFVVWGSGRQGRAFIHVDDVVRGILLALEFGWGAGHIQLGPAVCTPIREIAEAIVSISKKDITIKYDIGKPEGDMSRSANYSKAKRLLGWEPTVEIEFGLAEQYNWIQSQINISS